MGVFLLTLLLQTAAAPPPTQAQSIFLKAEAAWEHRALPDYVEWNMNLSYRYTDGSNTPLQAHVMLRTFDHHCSTVEHKANDGAPMRSQCNGPYDTPFFFNVAAAHPDSLETDPFREPPPWSPDVISLVSPSRYDITLAGVEQVDTHSVYHLSLTPVGDARSYPLRALWVDTGSYEVRRLGFSTSGAPGTMVTYDFSQYGDANVWWVSRMQGSWSAPASAKPAQVTQGSLVSTNVAFPSMARAWDVMNPYSTGSTMKTIASVRSSPLCSAVHTLLVPFLTMERADHALFGAMNEDVQKYIESAQVGLGSGPGEILSRANADWHAAQTYDNLAKVDLFLKSSYEKTPKGKDTALDAVRDRIQAIVDMERIETDWYGSLAAPRHVSYDYWKSTMAEIAHVNDLNGTSSIAATPPPEEYAGSWLTGELASEQYDFAYAAVGAVNKCGVK